MHLKAKGKFTNLNGSFFLVNRNGDSLTQRKGYSQSSRARLVTSSGGCVSHTAVDISLQALIFCFIFEKLAGAPQCHLRRREAKFRVFTDLILHK